MNKLNIALATILCMSIILTSCSSSKAEKGNLLKASSDDLKKTSVTAHLEKQIKEGENIIYCSTFQIAWNELADNIIKEDIKLKDAPFAAEALNHRLASKNDLSDKDYIAMSGFGKDDIVSKINKALKQKFKDNAPVVEEDLNSDDILAYAYLYKNIEFKDVFEKIKEPIVFNGEKVQSFGINKSQPKARKLEEQVQVVDYKDKDDFIIKLKSKSDKDEIILAKITPEKDLVSTIKKIDRRIEASDNADLTNYTSLKIPKFNFDITKSYDELVSKYLMNKGFEDYFIRKAMQNIKFKLDEKGAVLKSEAKIVGEKSAAIVEPRAFIFDKPFMIILKEKEANMPYFSMWVDNTEIMVK